MIKINILKIIEGKKTYPSWSTGRTYSLQTKDLGDKIVIYYKIENGRIIKRTFPKILNLTPKLSYALGILEGEGATALGKSNYRRFTMTNSDPKVINIVLNELEKHGLFSKNDLKVNNVQIVHYTDSEKEVFDYWSKQLRIPVTKFKSFDMEKKTTKKGVCHIYVSDVLLRRVIDLIKEEFYK